MPLVVLGIAGLLAAGYFIDKTGEGVNDAGNGLLKIAAVAGAGYLAARHFKVLK